MIRKSKTFVSDHGRIPPVGESTIEDRIKRAAKIHIARHSKDIDEMIDFLDMLGLL